MNADNPKLTETFDRYLEGKMSRRERFEFEGRLKIDPDFAEAFELHKEIDFILFQDELNFFRQELEKIVAQDQTEERKAPMMVSKPDESELEEAILDQDVMNLREKLSEIYSEIDDEIQDETIPKYAPIEQAVEENDAVALHDELEKFNIDPDFDVVAQNANQLSFDQEVDQAITETDVMQYRNKLDEIAKEMMPAKSTKTIKLQKTMVRAIAAAAIVVLMVSSGLFMNGNIGTDAWINNGLDQQTEDLAGPGTTRGTNLDENSQDQWIDFAYMQFLKGDYQDAAIAFKLIEETESNGPDIWIYHAKALYELKNYSEAMKYFQLVLDNNDSNFLEEAEWSVIKCLLHLGQKDDARLKLKKIVQSPQGHDYIKPATKAYKKLR